MARFEFGKLQQAAPTRCIWFLRAGQDMPKVAWSPNGKLIALGDANGLAQVWDVAQQKIVLTYQGHASVVWEVDWSSDGKRIVSASQDGTAQIWQP